jgi:hypothetical protein
MATNDAASTRSDSALHTKSLATGPSIASRIAKLQNWAVILGLALLAGVAAWLVGEFTFDYFKPSLAASENYQNPRALNLEMPGVVARNGALTFGALGGVLGLALGLAGGLIRRSATGVLIGALTGLILGAAAGAVPSFALMPWQWRNRNEDPSTTLLLVPTLIHLGLWSGVGLAAGLAFGIGTSGLKLSRLIEAALAGLAGAMLGTFVFEMVGALLLPLAKTANPIAETSSARLLARLCVALFVALGAIRALPSRPEPKTGSGPIVGPKEPELA